MIEDTTDLEPFPTNVDTAIAFSQWRSDTIGCMKRRRHWVKWLMGSGVMIDKNEPDVVQSLGPPTDTGESEHYIHRIKRRDTFRTLSYMYDITCENGAPIAEPKSFCWMVVSIDKQTGKVVDIGWGCT